MPLASLERIHFFRARLVLESKSMGLENGLGLRQSSWGSNPSCCVVENTWETGEVKGGRERDIQYHRGDKHTW